MPLQSKLTLHAETLHTAPEYYILGFTMRSHCQATQWHCEGLTKHSA